MLRQGEFCQDALKKALTKWKAVCIRKIDLIMARVEVNANLAKLAKQRDSNAKSRHKILIPVFP